MPLSYGAIKGSILQGHIPGQYSWVLHGTETGLRSALVLLHRSVPYLAKKLFVKISILLVKLNFISIYYFQKETKC